MNRESSSNMTTATWRDDLAAIGGTRSWNDTREAWLARIARKCGVPFRTIKSLWYGEQADPRASIAERVRSAAQLARSEAGRLAAHYEGLANDLVTRQDADFFSPHIDALRNAAVRLRGANTSPDQT